MIGDMDDTLRELASVEVLWRQPDTLALWGIPYGMRAGQAPYDIWRARRDGPARVGVSDWIWLGQPGWWGDLSRERRAAVEAYLAALDPDVIPGGPCEWAEVSRPVVARADAERRLREAERIRESRRALTAAALDALDGAGVSRG
jgi:hypothetical protein